MQIKIKTGQPSEKTVFVKKSNLGITGRQGCKFPSLDENLTKNLQGIQLNDFSINESFKEKIPNSPVHLNNTFRFDFKIDV